MAEYPLKKRGARAKYDWDILKQKFFDSNIPEALTFIRGELGGIKGGKMSTNIQRHILGWTEEKKTWKRKKSEKIQEKLDEDLAEKLKINLEDLLTQKRLLFSLDAKYLEILARMSSKDNLPTEEELKFFENYPEALRDIYKRIQTELGLPTEPEEKKVK